MHEKYGSFCQNRCKNLLGLVGFWGFGKKEWVVSVIEGNESIGLPPLAVASSLAFLSPTAPPSQLSPDKRGIGSATLHGDRNALRLQSRACLRATPSACCLGLPLWDTASRCGARPRPAFSRQKKQGGTAGRERGAWRSLASLCRALFFGEKNSPKRAL